MVKKARPWTDKDQNELIWLLGVYSLEEIAKKLQRSVKSIRMRIWREKIDPLAGVFTQDELSKKTGYHIGTLARARDSLGQKWKRYGKKDAANHAYMITEDQADEIVEFLKEEGNLDNLPFVTQDNLRSAKWSFAFDKCTECSTNGNEPHQRYHGNGMCSRCWGKNYYRSKLNGKQRPVRGDVVAEVNQVDDCGRQCR